MTCRECKKDGINSPINNICVNCAAKYWRTCRTHLNEFVRDNTVRINNPLNEVHLFFKSVKLRSVKKWPPSDSFYLENYSYKKFSEKVLDALFKCDYQLHYECFLDTDYVFIEQKDFALIKDCEIYFKPKNMYQYTCDKCFNYIESKKRNVLKGINDINKSIKSYKRNCVICDLEFNTLDKSYFLCNKCSEKWLKCSNGCGGYFKPFKNRLSESYCYKCRNNIYFGRSDLLQLILNSIKIKTLFDDDIRYRISPEMKIKKENLLKW